MKKDLISILFLGLNVLYASIPTSKEDLLKTTISELNKQDSTKYPNKSPYQLEETTDTTGDFVITKYWSDNGSHIAVDFDVKFNNILGDIIGNTFMYNWQIIDGKRSLVETTSKKSDIIAKVDSYNNVRIAKQDNKDILHSFIGLSATSSDSAVGGSAIQHHSGTIGHITGDFIGNYAYSSAGSAYGGAISYSGKIDRITGSFIGNYTSSVNGQACGGAIYMYNGTITLNVASNNHIRSFGNYTEENGVNTDSGGGFLYMEKQTTTMNFNIEKNSSYTIGDGCMGYDSIASPNSGSVINKNGKGELIVNSSMEYYLGILNVNEGKMSVNNKLGASRIVINNGATLATKISGEKFFTNRELNFSNDGTLILVASEKLAGGNYSISEFARPEEVYFGNVKTYGGTFDHSTGSFIVQDAQNINVGESVSANIQSNGRVLVRGVNEADTSVMMNFNSLAEVTVNSVIETTNIDVGFKEIIKKVSVENLLLAEAFAFDVENLGTQDTVNLSFDVGAGYDISQFKIYHKDDEFGWELANVTNLEYDGEYLSFTVDGFSSYAYVASVPEPSTYAVIFGALALGFVACRRRK